jgi:hypothetical protein
VDNNNIVKKSRKLSQAGSSLVLAMGLSTVAVIGSYFAYNSVLQLEQMTHSESNSWEVDLINKKALTLAGYFVSNNLVLCREEGWRNNSTNKKCKWGGAYQPEFNGKTISRSDFGIQDKTDNYDGDGFLVMEVVTPLGKEDVTVELSFQLVNWENDPTVRNLIGEIPAGNALADADYFAVLVRAKSEFIDQTGQEAVATTMGFIRRPLANPMMTVTQSPRCDFSCVVGVSDNPFPECRGPREVPAISNSAVTMQIKNDGPGVIYRLAYARDTIYNPAFYPGETTRTDTVEMIGAKNNLQQPEVLMPGDSFTYVDSIPCLQPITVRRPPTYSSQTVEVDGPGGTQTIRRETLTTTYEKVLSYFYNLNVARFTVDALGDNAFLQSYPEVPLQYQRKVNSVIEPRKTGGFQVPGEVSSEVQVDTIETSIQRIIRVRREPPPTFDSGGDGGGGGC